MSKKPKKLDYLFRIYSLARAFGRRKVAVVFLFALVQGVSQVAGVTSIFPFLALASNPEEFKSSKLGVQILERLPEWGDSELLLASGLLAIFLLLLTNIINIGAEISRNRYAQQFGHWLRCALLERIINHPYDYFFNQNSSRLIKIITGDVFTFTNGVFLPLLDTIARVLIVLFLTLTLFLVNPVIALGATAIFGIFYFVIFFSLRGVRKRTSDGALNASRGTIKETQQLLNGIKPIKAQDSEAFFFDRFKAHSKQMADLMSWVNVYGNVPRYLIEPLAFGGLVVVAMILHNRGGDFTAILPSLAVMALAGYRMMPAMQAIYSQLNQLTTMRYAFEEVNEEFFREPPLQAPAISRPPGSDITWGKSLKLEEVCYSYPGTPNNIVANVSLELKKGSSVGVIGPSGSGKSTIADLIMGILVPSSGQITIDGDALTPDNVSSWRKHVAYVPQEAFLIDDSIAANVAFGVEPDEIDLPHLEEVCRKAQILDLIKNKLEDGFETIVGERGIRLSGGQRQRIGLARALYRNPSLLVLDEATSALDDETESNVVSAIESLKGDITLLVVTHRLTSVRNCDLWWSVEDGQLNVLTSLSGDLIEQHTAHKAKA